MKNWTIQRAMAEDAEPLAACIDAAYASYKSDIPSLPDVSGGLDTDIRDHIVWVAVINARVIGGAVLVLDLEQAKLANVAVHPDQDGQGVGRALIEAVEASARKAGFSVLRLNTHIAMLRNIEFYKRLGWQEIDRAGDTVRMTKSL